VKKNESDKKVDKTYDPWKILIYPHLAEKSMNLVEVENKLVFIVNKKADKKQIKEAIEKGFDVKVEKVSTEITARGKKKAYIKLDSKYLASDIASRLGIL
jgi:large subunit ribosomal protein L23